MISPNPLTRDIPIHLELILTNFENSNLTETDFRKLNNIPITNFDSKTDDILVPNLSYLFSGQFGIQLKLTSSSRWW